jgi:hypothetical protein
MPSASTSSKPRQEPYDVIKPGCLTPADAALFVSTVESVFPDISRLVRSEVDALRDPALYRPRVRGLPAEEVDGTSRHVYIVVPTMGVDTEFGTASLEFVGCKLLGSLIAAALKEHNVCSFSGPNGYMPTHTYRHGSHSGDQAESRYHLEFPNTGLDPRALTSALKSAQESIEAKSELLNELSSRLGVDLSAGYGRGAIIWKVLRTHWPTTWADVEQSDFRAEQDDEPPCKFTRAKYKGSQELLNLRDRGLIGVESSISSRTWWVSAVSGEGLANWLAKHHKPGKK